VPRNGARPIKGFGDQPMSYDTSEQELPPVTDWVNDWDWLDEQWGPNAIDIWNQPCRRWQQLSATGGPTCQ